MSKFQSGDRVNMPGAVLKNIQGVICHTVDAAAPSLPVYFVKWLDAGGQSVEGIVSETDLLTVNDVPRRKPAVPKRKR